MNYYKTIYDVLSPVLDPEVYPLDAWQESELPYLVLEIGEIITDDAKNNAVTNDVLDFVVFVLDKNLDNVQVTAAKVRNTLNRFCDETLKNVRFEQSSTVFDSERRCYVMFLNFTARIVLDPYGSDYSAFDYSEFDYATT